MLIENDVLRMDFLRAQMSPHFVFQVIDILLGGGTGGKFRLREFTDIDKNIINNYLGYFSFIMYLA